MKKICIFLPILYLLSVSISLGFVTTAKTALVIENTTGDVLLSKQIHKPIPPASMSKLMTLWMEHYKNVPLETLFGLQYMLMTKQNLIQHLLPWRIFLMLKKREKV